MKIIIIITYIFCAFMVTINAQNIWTQKANFGGTGRFGAVAFSIGDKGYLGTGDANTGQYEHDFWEYNPGTDTWMQKANLAGDARWGAVGFSIGSKGYIGTGSASNGPYLNDLWEYDTTFNQWNQKTSIPIGRYDAGVFVIGTSAYIVGGADGDSLGFLKDTWEYNSISDTWIQRTDFGGGERFEPTTFAIGNTGYCGFGNTTISFDGLTNDFWAFNAALNTWSQLASFPGSPRADAVGFAINSLGFIATGWMSSGFGSQDFWMYKPAQNLWVQLPNFGGQARVEARGFVINNRAYIGTGSVSGNYVNDFWEYTPDSALGISEQVGLMKITLEQNVPNPTKSSTKIDYTLPSGVNKGLIVFYDTQGKEVKRFNVDNTFSTLMISTEDLQSGLYYYNLQTTQGISEVMKLVTIK